MKIIEIERMQEASDKIRDTIILKLDAIKEQISEIRINMAKLPCDEHSLERIMAKLNDKK